MYKKSDVSICRPRQIRTRAPHGFDLVKTPVYNKMALINYSTLLNEDNDFATDLDNVISSPNVFSSSEQWQNELEWEWQNGVVLTIAQLVEKLDEKMIGELYNGKMPKELLSSELIKGIEQRFEEDKFGFADGSIEMLVLSACARNRYRMLKPGSMVEFNGVYFQRESPCASFASGDKLKVLFDDKSSFREALYFNARQAYPSEVFSLIIAGLEGKLNFWQEKVVNNMMIPYESSEWLGADFKREGDKLFVYLEDPFERAIIANGKLAKRSFNNVIEFDVSGIHSRTLVDLCKFPEEFIIKMYSRPFKELPKEIRIGSTRAQVYLPPSDGIRWPVSRGFLGSLDPFGLFALNAPPDDLRHPASPEISKYPSTDSDIGYRASRWVRKSPMGKGRETK